MKLIRSDRRVPMFVCLALRDDCCVSHVYVTTGTAVFAFRWMLSRIFLFSVVLLYASLAASFSPRSEHRSIIHASRSISSLYEGISLSISSLVLHGSQQTRSPLINWFLLEKRIPFTHKPPRPSPHPFGQGKCRKNSIHNHVVFHFFPSLRCTHDLSSRIFLRPST